MNPADAISLLEQAGNKVDCDAPSRRLLFAAVDLLKKELESLEQLRVEKRLEVPKPA